MAYSPTTDFVGLWRASGGNVSKLEMPGLDFVVAALGRAGLITVTASATAPVANQATTAWLHTASPSSSAEGALNLWNASASAYAPATPPLFLAFLDACTGANGVSWWTSTGGPPLNTVGLNGDFAVRLDQPGGIYGPKVAGAWPATPLPGTTTAFISADLDAAFGAATGEMLFRGISLWQGLPIGAADTILSPVSGVPAWRTLNVLLDEIFGTTRGSILSRGASAWAGIPPGAAGTVIKSNGPGADPSYAVPEFASGTSMLFYQATAPTGWTKRTDTNDIGLRLTGGGTGGTISGSVAFSTVFGQTATGGTAISVAQMPAHHHTTTADGLPVEYAGAGSSGVTSAGVAQPTQTSVFSMADNGGGLPHTHSINMQLTYADVIVCVKN
jgi:hypothetical protein